MVLPNQPPLANLLKHVGDGQRQEQRQFLKPVWPTRSGTEPLRAALRACRTHFAGAAVFSAFVNLLYLTPTLYMMQVYDRIVPTGGLTTLVLISAVTVFALATLAGLEWVRGRLFLRASLRLDRMLARRVLERLVDLRGAAPEGRALREFDNVRAAVSGPGVLALFDAPWTPLYLGCCFLLHPAIGALTLVGGIALVSLAWLSERDTRGRATAAIRLQNHAYASHERLSADSETVRALGMRKSSIAMQLKDRSEATGAQADAQLTGGRYASAIKFVRLMMQSAALGVGALLAIRGEISPGAIIAASVLLSRAVAPVELLVGAWPSLVQGATSWRALTNLFAATHGVDRDRTRLPDPVGRLQIEGVSVKLSESEPPQLRGVNLNLRPGETLGVIGPSGSGKTTLARVISGAIRPTLGVIRLDGAEYDARDGDELARWIGYLPQAATLFAGSIKDNISRFAVAGGAETPAVDRAVVRAAIAAGAHDLILKLPNGYDTILGPSGQGLSAGQAQRVALARALYEDPVLLILDEPNSNLDQEGESALMQAILAAASGGAAVVIIAHRAGVLSRVDRLMVLRDGVVQFEGPREDVLAKVRAGQAVAGKPVADLDVRPPDRPVRRPPVRPQRSPG